MYKEKKFNRVLSFILIVAMVTVSMYVPGIKQNTTKSSDINEAYQLSEAEVKTQSAKNAEKLKTYMSESVNKVKSKKETAESLKNILEYVSELKKSVTDEMNKAQKYAKEENLKTVLKRVEESRKEVSKDFADTENDINRVIKLCDKKDVSNKELDNEYANLTDEVRKITENEDIETKVPDKPHQTSKSYDVSESVGKQTPDSSLYTTSLLKKIENGECDGESTQDEALILSDEAKKIADTLNTPYEIYKYVKDTVDFKPYYGLRYGATGTFTCKVGNDYDTASLLIAMLKYRGFEARYVVGTVQIEIKEAINLTGADNEQGAVDILSMLGIPTTVVKTDGKITAVRIEHVWVEAYIPYDSYRGSGKVAGAKEWIPMDASYKKYEKQEKLNYDSDFNEEIKKLSEELKNENATGFSENLESIQDRITEYANEESIETDTILSKRKIKEDTLSLLPSVLPYEVIKENAVFDRAPEKAKAKITFKLTTPFYGTYAIGDSDKEVTFEAASLYGKNVWIEYIPETDEDEKIIEKYGDIYSTPAYLIKVIPCIMADGECVAKGNAVRPGTYTIFGMDIYEVGCETVSVDNPLVAGGSYAVSFDYGKISEADLSDAKTELLSLKEKLESGKESNDRAMGETLSGIGTTYFAQLDMADSMLEGILNVTTWRQISEGIFGYKPRVTSIFGAPIGISEGTVFVDIDTDTYGVAYNGDKIRTSEVNNDQENEKDSNDDKENKVDHNPVRDFMVYSGFVGSYLESFVLEETVGTFAVSTMEVFKVALSRGMELVKIDSQNSDEFEKIKADDKTLSEMKNAVKAGRTIIVPREEMCYYGWKGTAYIALDTSTGEGAYMISGSMCGGSTAINIIVGTINVIIAAYDLIAAIDMIILGLANPVLLTVALVFLGVAVYAYIDSMFTLFMYCSTGEERYGEEMMTNLYFNVTFGVITKVAGTLGKKVVRKIGDTLVEMGVDSKYVKNFFTEEFGGVSWDDSPGTGGSGSHGSGGNGSGSGSHGTGEIPGGSSGNHGSGGTGSGSGSHGTGYIPGGGSPDYWNFIDAWELLSKKYGEKVASILQEFGEDGLKLAEKYGDDLARIIDNLEPTEAKKAVSLINSYGDDALEMFKEGKSFDEVKKIVEGGLNSYADFSKAISDIGMRSDLTDAQKIRELQKLFESSNYKADINIPSDIQYVKGFDAKGNVIYDWPPKLGFDESTIKSISRTDGLPNTWDRYGYMGGSNFADVPPTGKYTYSERAIPYVENEAAYHTGTFNNATYFDKIDAIKNGDIDGLNTILSKEGIANVNSSYFKNLQNTYNDFIEDTTDAVGSNIDATYGLKGTAASWGDMSGGAGQYVTPLNGNTMKRLGIIN